MSCANGELLAEPIRRDAEIRRPRHAADGRAHGRAQHVGNALGLRQVARPLGHRREHRSLLEFLILVAIARLRGGRAADGDERAGRPERVDDRRGQIRRAGAELHDAERRLAGDARVGVRHRQGGALAAPQDHAHAFVILHFDQRILRRARQREDVLGAVSAQKFRQRLRYRQCVCRISRGCARHSLVLGFKFRCGDDFSTREAPRTSAKLELNLGL